MANTTIKQAETFRRALVIRDIKANTVMDLTDCTAHAQMRTQPGGELLAEASCSVDALNGTVTALWTAEQTAAFPVGDCGYDIWLKNGDEQKPIFTEKVTVVKSYTDMTEG